MPETRLQCELIQRFAAEFRLEILNICERCQVGEGACLAELLLAAAENNEPEDEYQ